jgi:hypothetical protein
MAIVRTLYPGFDPEIERWLPIADWPGYDVSDHGRVRTWWGAGSGQQGRRAIGNTFKCIGYAINTGHRGVLLYRNGSTESWRAKIHTLVLTAFVGPCPEGMECLHGDGNPANNRLDNLRWGTRSENQQDAVSHGSHNRAVLTDDDIPKIWEEILAGDADRVIAKRWNVSATGISNIRTGQAWVRVARHLPGWPIRRTG